MSLPTVSPTPTVPESTTQPAPVAEKQRTLRQTLLFPNSDATAGSSHYGSTPELRSLIDNSNSASGNKKRKMTEALCGSSMDVNIRDLIKNLSEEQNKRFDELQSTILSLQDQNNQLTKSVEVMSIKYDDFLAKISNLESERKEDKRIIGFLEDKLEFLEKKARSTGIEIRNVSKKEGETKEDLCLLLKSIGKTINVNIADHDIKDIYRTKAKDSPIIAELTTVIEKEKFFAGVKSFNKPKKLAEKLNTTHLNIEGPTKPVFVSESLTFRAQKLFHSARSFQKVSSYAYCWTSHGIVYLRKDQKAPHIKINSEQDIEALRRSA